MSGNLFVVSAPSGAGKTTLVNALLKEVGNTLPLRRVITYTTRSIGVGEQAGVDYHFISESEFKRKIEKGFFLEWSAVYGAYYGTPLSIIEEVKKGRSYILIIDREGARAIRALIPDAIFIWIYTKSIAVLQARLVMRGRDSQKKIEKRLMLAEKEMMSEEKKRFFSHHVCNDLFKVAVNDLVNIVQSYFCENSPKVATEAVFGG